MAFQKYFAEGSFKVKFQTIQTDEEAEVRRVGEEKRRNKKIREKTESQNKMIQVHEKVEKSQNTIITYNYRRKFGS